MKLPLAFQGVYWTIQGEGAMLGMPQVFIRLAGCSIGCAECDTDYAVFERVEVGEIARRVVEMATSATEWVWITGGEPTDHTLGPLIELLHRVGFRIALATAGVRPVKLGFLAQGVDYLSVSPHSAESWTQRSGDQLNLVPGLNGLELTALAPLLDSCEKRFTYRYVTPLAGKPETLAQCLDWIKRRPGYRLGVQAHKTWQLP